MNTNLFDHVNIDKTRTFVPDGLEADSAKACNDYNAVIRKQGGVDLQLLGLGHNGHIGFNEPGAAFEKETHCVDLTESTIEANKRFFESEDDVPRQAYTMGIIGIRRCADLVTDHPHSVVLFAHVQHGFDKVLAVLAEYPGNADNEILVQCTAYCEFTVQLCLSVDILRCVVLAVWLPWCCTLSIENIVGGNVDHLAVQFFADICNILSSVHIDGTYLGEILLVLGSI